MSGPEETISNRGQPLTDLDNRGPASAARPAAPDDDRFAAAFAAARGTVSPELDLNGILDEPVATRDEDVVGARRPGS